MPARKPEPPHASRTHLHHLSQSNLRVIQPEFSSTAAITCGVSSLRFGLKLDFNQLPSLLSRRLPPGFGNCIDCSPHQHRTAAQFFAAHRTAASRNRYHEAYGSGHLHLPGQLWIHRLHLGHNLAFTPGMHLLGYTQRGKTNWRNGCQHSQDDRDPTPLSHIPRRSKPVSNWRVPNVTLTKDTLKVIFSFVRRRRCGMCSCSHQQLRKYADEMTFGTAIGLGNVFEVPHLTQRVRGAQAVGGEKGRDV